jgi:hypothetical protein
MVLLKMRHFVNQRRKALFDRPGLEVRRVQRDFVGHLLAVAAAEPAAREIAVGLVSPLHGDQARRQPALEQRTVEVVVGGGQLVVGAPGRVAFHVEPLIVS